jgi:hypothetical protein
LAKILFVRVINQGATAYAFVHGRDLWTGGEHFPGGQTPYGLSIAGQTFMPVAHRPHNEQDANRGLPFFAQFALTGGTPIGPDDPVVFTRNDGEQTTAAIDNVQHVQSYVDAIGPETMELHEPLEVSSEKPLPEECRGKVLVPSPTFRQGRRTGLVVVRDGGRLSGVGVDVSGAYGVVRDGVQVLGQAANRPARGVTIQGVLVKAGRDQYGISAFGLESSIVFGVDVVADRQLYAPPNFINRSSSFLGVNCRSYTQRDGQSDRLMAGPLNLVLGCSNGPGGRGLILQNGQCGYYGMAIVSHYQHDLDICEGGGEGLLFECLGSVQGMITGTGPDKARFTPSRIVAGQTVSPGMTVVIPSQNRFVMVVDVVAAVDALGLPCFDLTVTPGVTRAVNCAVGFVPTEVSVLNGDWQRSRTGLFVFGASAGLVWVGNRSRDVLDPVVLLERTTDKHFAQHVMFREAHNESIGHQRETGPIFRTSKLEDLPGVVNY